eukprot:TRINITY_DN1235_c1_g1_i1.p1 TRINITY_DN1235_c1_g1~~TRINITY_DN1235_c1_g1_i1.p1  ORF type:complete len:639 (+),score=196.87 TRINITY_DN1235_c1_g1_i1:127-2043(+)
MTSAQHPPRLRACGSSPALPGVGKLDGTRNASMVSVAESSQGASEAASCTGTSTPKHPGLERSHSDPLLRSNLSDLSACAADQPLAAEWSIWFDKVQEGEEQQEDPSSLVELGSFSTVRGFWEQWDALHVQNLRDGCSLRVFRKGIKPLWHDPHNCGGGRWAASGVPRGMRKALWTRVVRALVQDGIEDGSAAHSTCGVVLSARSQGDSVQVWVDGGLMRTGQSGSPCNPATPQHFKQIFFPDDADDWTNFSFLRHATLAHQLHQQQQQQQQARLPQYQPPQPHQPQYQMQPQPVPVQSMCLDGVFCGMRLPSGAMVTAPPPGPCSQPMQCFTLPCCVVPPQQVQGQHAPVRQATVISSPQHQPQQPQHVMHSPAQHLPMSPVSSGHGYTTVSTHSLPPSGPSAGEPADPVERIQGRAKQIRIIRKKIRYINFFLARQGRGRALTDAETSRIRSLPTLERELAALEEKQAREVEEQKHALGTDSLEFLRKPQQPMTFNSESERRFKLMRALRKKIRFIHYHIERQRQGKTLSPAEQQKVQALPEFERTLAQLEAEESASREADGTTAATSHGAVPLSPDFGSPMSSPPLSPCSASAISATNFPGPDPFCVQGALHTSPPVCYAPDPQFIHGGVGGTTA